MTENKDTDKKMTLGLSRPGQLELRKTVEGGQVRQSFSHGRSKTVQVEVKKKRKVSAYQREFGRQLKRLKRKHPRTPVTRLMKRAHAATRKARRGK